MRTVLDYTFILCAIVVLPVLASVLKVKPLHQSLLSTRFLILPAGKETPETPCLETCSPP